MSDGFPTKLVLALLLSGLWMPAPLYAAETEPIIVRAAVGNADEDIWVGQRILLQVDVLARDGWAQIKSARDYEVPGAYVVRLQTQGTRMNEIISGVAYSGQRYELSLFAQKGGKIVVPPVPIDVVIRRWGDQAGTESRQLKTPAVTFDVQIPPGAEKIPGIISTTELKARQAWAPQSQAFKVGDAVKRTIVLSAVDISGMAFTPLVYPSISGVGIYTDEPAVEDRFNRGSLTGERTERVTYLFERDGNYELPEIDITWWDLVSKELKRVVLPSLEVRIAGGVGAEGQTASGPAVAVSRKIPIGLMLVVFVLSGVLFFVAWRFRYALQSRWQHWLHVRSQSEKAYFLLFRKACRQNDAKAAYNRLLAWLKHAASGRNHTRGVSTLKDLLETADCENLTKAVGDLEERLFKKAADPEAQTPWRGNALNSELARWRDRHKRTGGKPLTGEVTLAPLNPQ